MILSEGGISLPYVLSLILELSIVVAFNTYIMDLTWSKKQLFFLVIFGIIPTLFMLPFIGAVAAFYFFLLLTIIVYRKVPKKLTVFHVIMSVILLVLAENTSSIIIMSYVQTDQPHTTIRMYVLLIIFGVLLAMFYKKVMIRLLSRFIIESAFVYIILALSLGTLVFMYINIMAIDQNNFYESVKSNFVLFFVFLLLLVVSFFILLYLAFQRYKLKRREEELRNFETYVASIEEINRDMRKFKHDYVNMLTSLKTFIDDKNYEGLHTYYYDHILKMDAQERLNEQALMMLNHLKVDSLKGLLTTKILQAQSRQVAFYVEVVEEITDIPVEPIQLNRMVGILLDNAIEAAYEAENKEVRVALIRMDKTVLFVVQNTYDGTQNLKIHELFQEGFSTKGKDRGLGLSTLREIKGQYPSVNIRTKIHPPYFIQELEFGQEEGK